MTISRSQVEGWKPTVIMVLQNLLYAWMTIFFKLAAEDGMDIRVAMTYRFIFGAATMVPIAFFFERKIRPKLTWKVLFFAFLSGLFGGALGQNIYIESMVLTSATFASAMLNLLPAMTFLVALCFRMEKLGWHTKAGKAKVFGTFLGIGGAMLFTFYKGPNITIWKTHLNLVKITSNHHHHLQTSSKTTGDNPVLGIILAFLSCILFSLWVIVQGKGVQYYPCPLSFSALAIFMALVLNFIATSCMQRDWSQWELGWNIRLLTVVYSGIFGTTMIYTLLTVALTMRGPVFVSAFSPLVLLIVATVGSLVLDENLHLGSFLGGIVIICGLYVICWGKDREMKMIDDCREIETKAEIEDGVNNKILEEKNKEQIMQVENKKI